MKMPIAEWIHTPFVRTLGKWIHVPNWWSSYYPLWYSGFGIGWQPCSKLTRWFQGRVQGLSPLSPLHDHTGATCHPFQRERLWVVYTRNVVDLCSLVKGDSRGTHSREYGINQCSILNQLRYFSVVSGALVPDVMHDLLEGVLQYEVKLLLTQFISEDHYFTLEQLNHRIESLELGYSEARDRPTQITSATLSSNDNLLKQSGTHICTCMCVVCIQAKSYYEVCIK